MKTIFKAFTGGGLELQNHIVMAPMTRSRAIDNLPNDLMTRYYEQRSSAGLIITEGTAPEPGGSGYARIPGIYTESQVLGWKNVTDAVHRGGAKIFLQLMHTGRIGHVDNLPGEGRLVGASEERASGKIFTDTRNEQEYSIPVALTTSGVREIVAAFVKAAQNAVRAGFDGVELHAANGYLLEQFLNPHVNNRQDEYGGNIENRARLILEVAEQTARAIGEKKLGIRFSPYSTLGDLKPYDDEEVLNTYRYLSEKLNGIGIAYIHISAGPGIPQKTFDAIRTGFSGAIILCNNLSPETAEEKLQEGFADLVAFGRNFLANPDLIKRIKTGAPINQPDYTTLYTPGEKGYTDYPVLELAATA
jgi:N-ethylmaleimide reductase